MAPELFQGQAKSLQSEVYALGVIFYEWLSGQRLQATDYLDWAFLHCQRLKVELPQHLQAFQGLLEEMLSKQKQHRLADFQAVKDYLMTEIEWEKYNKTWIVSYLIKRVFFYDKRLVSWKWSL